MMRLRHLSAAAPIIFVAATAVPRPIANLAPGLTYSFASHVQMTDQNGKTSDRVTMTGRASLLGDKVRIDLDSIVAPPDPHAQQADREAMRGSYILALDAGRRLIFVDPAKKQYAEFQSLAMLQGINALFNGSNGLIRIQATNVHIDADKVGPGPVLLGHPTVHYRLNQSMTVQTKILFKTMKSRDSTIIDYYYAPDLKNFVNPFLAGSQSMQNSLDLFGPDYKQQMETARARLYQGGAPLRTVSTAWTFDDAGKVTHTTVSTTEVTQLSTGNVDPSIFEIPAGYTNVENNPQAAAAANGAAQPATAKSPADTTHTDVKKEVVKKGLRGLLGRPE